MYTIKKLEWVERDGWFYSDTPFTNYRVLEHEGNYRPVYTTEYISAEKDNLTVDQSKDVAQKHFESEVMKYLNVRSETDGE